MSKDQFCFSWVSYKNHISQGFARLQQVGNLARKIHKFSSPEPLN